MLPRAISIKACWFLLDLHHQILLLRCCPGETGEGARERLSAWFNRQHERKSAAPVRFQLCQRNEAVGGDGNPNVPDTATAAERGSETVLRSTVHAVYSRNSVGLDHGIPDEGNGSLSLFFRA